MKNEISVITKMFNIIILCVTILVFIFTMLHNFKTTQPFASVTITAFINALALAFAAMPSGLNAISTIVIATGMKRILSDKIIFKDSKAVEDIGKVNVICADKTGVFTHDKMVLREIFDGKSPDDFDEETIVTINKFFENNLNVSETSRQLYIHRNTLVYRLDKIQKLTNLDLRVFEDAITFKMALMVVKYMKYMENMEF
jgi:carbohydrate diacid regulator